MAYGFTSIGVLKFINHIGRQGTIIMPRKAATQTKAKTNNGVNLGIEEELWQTAEKIKLKDSKSLNLKKDDLFICHDIALDDETAANLSLQYRLKTV